MSNQIAFFDFCNVLEDIKTNRDKEYKRKTLERYFEALRNKGDSNLFPVVRLLAPSYERKRSYGMKEDALRRAIIKVLCLSRNSADSEYLRKANDFPTAAYTVLRKYFSRMKSILTVGDVNEVLDKIAAKSDKDENINRLFRNTSPFELKWIIRLILKDLKLGIGSKKILNLFHPDAESLFDSTNDLEHVCVKLHDRNVRLNEIEVSLFSAFSPMLSKRCDGKELFKSVSDETKLFYVENKFDGERFQLHMENGNFKYFSRRGFEFTKKFGNTYSTGIFTPLLKNCFRKDVKSVILDGEMMGYDVEKKQFGSKGMNFDVKNLTDLTHHQPCFCVFDILLLNGEVLTCEPLKNRKEKLKSIIKPIEGVILISEIFEAQGRREIIKTLNASAEKKDEGIVFKNPDSLYVTNSRNDGWWKMKLEYFADVMSDLDVIVMGGYLGKNEKIDRVVVGVAVPSKRGSRPTAFHSLSTIHTGLTHTEWDVLNSKLKDNLVKMTLNNSHEMYGLFFGKKKPDVWVKPEDSCILEVRASELIKTHKTNSDTKSNYTLRFPRIRKLRLDKPYYDCLTTEELQNLTCSNLPVEKLFKRGLEMEDIEYNLKKDKKPRTRYIINEVVVDKTVSDILKEKEFCVWTGDGENTKEDLERIIQENGGTITKSETQNTYCILMGNSHERIKYYKGNVDIVRLSWLFDILKYKKFCEYTPLDSVYITEKTKKIFMGKFDKLGDSYTQEISKGGLKKLETYINNLQSFVIRPLKSEIEDLHKEIQLDHHLSLFHQYTAYFDKYSIINDASSGVIYVSIMDELEFKFWGGKVVDVLNGDVNLVITNARDEKRTEKLLEMFQGEILTKDFIQNSIAKYLEDKEETVT